MASGLKKLAFVQNPRNVRNRLRQITRALDHSVTSQCANLHIFIRRAETWMVKTILPNVAIYLILCMSIRYQIIRFDLMKQLANNWAARLNQK